MDGIIGRASAPIQVKAAGPDDGLAEGQFVAYASHFGSIDSYGDIVDPGAFTRTLAEWGEKGGTVPVLWGHDMNDAFATIGGVLAAEEDDNGLKVTCELDLDNPTSIQVYKLLKGRRVNTMSFAYTVRDAEKKDDGYHLKDLDLHEVSVVHIPANPSAEVLSVKSTAASLAEAVKAGRTLSAKNESAIRDAVASLSSVLASLDGEDGKAAPAADHDQGEKASGEPEAKSGATDEEPPAAKSSVPDEEPKAGPSVIDLAATELSLLALGTEGESEDPQ